MKRACAGSGARVPARALAVGRQLHHAGFLPVSLAAMEERQATVTAHVGRRDGRTREATFRCAGSSDPAELGHSVLPFSGNLSLPFFCREHVPHHLNELSPDGQELVMAK